MAGETNGSGKGGGGGRVLAAILILLAAGLGGLVFYLHRVSRNELTRLKNAIEDYGEMVNMKRTIKAFQEKGRLNPAVMDAGGDPLAFLSTKARQAQIPANLFNITRNSDVAAGAWKETPYTVNLRGTKENSIARDAVVDFLRLSEEERPSIKCKNLTLAFQGQDLGNVALTLSSFQAKDAPAPPPK